LTPTQLGAAFVFGLTFLLLALGRLGRLPIPRGISALAGGAATAALLGLWRDPLHVVDFQVIFLLAGLMVLAGLGEIGGLFAGLRRALMRCNPGVALWLSLAVVGLASALLLNDAAVVVLVPFLVPALRALGLEPVPVVVLMAVAANAGSLLTPFGNPQNTILASHAGLGILDFLRAQWPVVALAFASLAIASWRLGRRANLDHATPPPAPTVPGSRPLLIACVGLFLALAAFGGRWRIGLGTAALVAAAVAILALRPRLGRAVDRAAWRALDWNVLSLFVGLYFLTAGLPSWFPSDRLPLASLDSPLKAVVGTSILSNLVGNVPATLVFANLDAAWTRLHAMFLVTVTTLGGALLLTGSAASLLAADRARHVGVEVRFWPFLKNAVPWVLPALAVGAVLTWNGGP
jgi:Na+/H+ antiporter NhaD/arsenite permease-like protein